MKKNVHTIFILSLFIASFNLCAQAIIENGWFYPKTPVSGIWGYPFTLDKSGESFVGVGQRIQSDTISRYLSSYDGPSYSNIADYSLKKMILGSSYSHESSEQITVIAYAIKRKILDTKIVNHFSPNSYYAIEGLSADSITIICKMTKKSDASSKAIDNILKKYLKTQTVAFAVFNALSNGQKDSSNGTVKISKYDSSEFKISLKNSDIVYAIKYAKVKQRSRQYYTVQDGTAKTIDTILSPFATYNIASANYNLDRNSGVLEAHMNFVRLDGSDTNNIIIGYISNSFNNNLDTVFISKGKKIDGERIRYENEAYKRYDFGGDKTINIKFSSNVIYNRNTSTLTDIGINSYGLYENCLYHMNNIFILYPLKKGAKP